MPAVKQQATRITITKAIEEKLRVLAEQGGPEGRLVGEKYIDAARGIARQLVARIDDARTRKEAKEGLNPYAAISIVKRVCPTAILPPDIGPLLGMFKKKILLLGLTEEHIETAAERAKRRYRHPMAMTFFVSRIDELVGEEPEATDGIEATSVNDGRG